jgi:hypothetical protein
MPKQNATESRWVDTWNINLIPAVAQLRPTVQVERRNLAAREMLLRRIRAEFEQMPGLSVTLQQATKLFGLSLDAGGRILRGLTEEGIPYMTADGRYLLRPRSE